MERIAEHIENLFLHEIKDELELIKNLETPEAKLLRNLLLYELEKRGRR